MSTSETQAPTKGHNQPDPYQQAVVRVEDLTDAANVWIKEVPEIASEEQADRASDFRNQLRAMKKSIESMRTEQVKPLRDQMEAINSRFKRLHSFLDKSYEHLSLLLTPWLEKKEAQRRAEEKAAREEAERKKREAEEAAAKATTIQEKVAAEEAADAAEEAEKDADSIASSKANVKGEYSERATGLRTYRSAEIADIDEAFGYYRDNPKVAEVLVKLANADIRAGRRRIPGFKVNEEKRV